MARQIEHVRVAHVVGERERGIDRVRGRDERSPRPRDHPQTHGADGREDQTRDAELLTRVEPPHAGAAGKLVATHAEEHRFAPVGLRGVEPERGDAVGPRRRSVRDMPGRCEVWPVLESTSRGERRGKRDGCRPEQRSRLWCDLEQEDRKRHQQQDHREVIAERHGVDREENGQTCP